MPTLSDGTMNIFCKLRGLRSYYKVEIFYMDEIFPLKHSSTLLPIDCLSSFLPWEILIDRFGPYYVTLHPPMAPSSSIGKPLMCKVMPWQLGITLPKQPHGPIPVWGPHCTCLAWVIPEITCLASRLLRSSCE